MGNKYKAYLPLIVIGILAVAFILGADSVLVFRFHPSMNTNTANSNDEAPTVNIILYEGEMPSGSFGFGDSPDNLTSPGPTIRLTIGDVVNITVHNVGKFPHAFALMSAPMTGSIKLYAAEIGSAGDALKPGQIGSMIVGPIEPGNIFYTSPVAGDAEAGLWGSIIVTGSGS